MSVERWRPTKVASDERIETDLGDLDKEEVGDEICRANRPRGNDSKMQIVAYAARLSVTTGRCLRP